jgi:hypothetical protein
MTPTSFASWGFFMRAGHLGFARWSCLARLIRDQAQKLCDLILLRENIYESKEKERNISDSSELSSKCFYLSVEGFR